MPRSRTHHRAAALAGTAFCGTLLAATLVAPGVASPMSASPMSASPTSASPTSGSTRSSVSPGNPASSEATDQVRTRRRYAIAATAPETAATGSSFTVAGTATTNLRRGRVERPVLLSERQGRSWTVLERARTTTYGEFGFTLDAGDTASTRVLRVDAPAYRGLRSARTSVLVVDVVASTEASDPTPDPTPDVPTEPPTPVDETPGYDDPELLPAGYVGLGSASAWTYLFDGGARWNPCQVIRWAYNPAGEGYPALADMQRAMAKISGASGLHFSYAGATPWRYLGNLGDPAFPADRADIVIGWANATELPALAGNVVGYGGGSGRAANGGDVRVRITRGFLVLDNGHVLPGGFEQSGWGQISLHEILHALGLGHAPESVQVMYGTAHRGNIRFGAGDLTGMQRIGAAPGCLS